MARVRLRALAWAPLAWSVVLALLLLGPALAPGYVLTYDMVWVPDLAVRPDVWGLGSGLPRAVPSDGVVAVLDDVVPGPLLQKAVLLGALVGGGTGASRLVPGELHERVGSRLVAVSAYQWSPLVAERLGLGAWPVLVGLGVLPWLVLLGRRWRETDRLPPALLVLVPLGSLSASAGVASAVVLLAAVAGSRGRTLRAAGLLGAANAPWWVTGLLHAGDATADRAGASVFALQGHGALPTPLEALALGGTWNSEVVLTSRDGILAWVGLAILAALLLAVRGWWRESGRREALALVVPWAIGLTLALSTWAAPGAMADLGATVPGGALLRDGARALVLCAPLVAVVAAHAAGRLGALVPEAGPRVVLAGALALVPVMLAPDATFGLSGRLDAVDYPASYDAVREAAAGVGGDALVLPLTSYRRPAWNDGRKVLDPMPRWLVDDVVASDRLVVGRTVVAGEDPRVDEADEALSAPTAGERADALAAIGVAVVVVEEGAGPVPEVEGTTVLHDGDFEVVALGEPRDPPGDDLRTAVTALAWTLFGACPVLAVVLAVVRRRDRRDFGG